ncbi:MAG TPA: hypothetical protein VFL49_01275 [Pseudolabrys sp.]|nr:hypothetical protein [Pseudolabrys sp.]
MQRSHRRSEAKHAEIGAAISGRVTELLARERQVTAGKLHLINLEGLKQRFGSQWEGKLELVANVMEGAFSRHLSPQDFFSRVGDGAYVIIFDQLNERDATLKCSLIAKDVLEKLFGNIEDAKDVAIQTAAANVDGSIDLKSSNPLDTIAGLLDDAQQHAIIVDAGSGAAPSFMEVSSPAPQSAPIISPIEQGPSDLSQLLRSAERRIERWQVHLPPKGKVIYDPAAARTRAPQNTAVDMTPPPIVSRTRVARTSPSTRFDNAQDVRFRYQPVWYAPKGVVIGYRCQLDFLTPTECISSEALVSDGGVPDAALKVDRLILHKGLTDLAQLRASGEKAIVICPLHAATFAAASAWRQFEQIAYGLTAEMRSLLIFEIVDAAAVGMDRQLVNTVRNLSRYARQIMARVPLHTLGFGTFHENGFSALSTSLSEFLHDEADIIRMIGRFCGGAKERGLLTLLNDASSISILVAAAAHGSDYIGGSAVAKDVSQLTGVLPFDLFDVYRPRLG